MIWLYLLGVFALGGVFGMVLAAWLIGGEVTRVERELTMARHPSAETAIPVHQGPYDQELETGEPFVIRWDASRIEQVSELFERGTKC